MGCIFIVCMKPHKRIKLNIDLLNDHCSGPVSRRWFLRAGTLGLTGLSMADVFRLQAVQAGKNSAPDTAVIYVWLAGGPPHMDTYDMKPNAPEDYRGPFRPINTNVSGIQVCELLPLHAKCADKFTLVRSITHTFSDHGGGSKHLMTGIPPATPTETVNNTPSVPSIVAKMREHIDLGLPNVITSCESGRDKVDTYAMGSAYLGPKYVPFTVDGDPSKAKFQIQNVSLNSSLAERLDDRMTLLDGVDRMRRDLDASGMMASMDHFNQRAISLMTSPLAREAFDLSREPVKLRERYGMHSWGQRALLARRLVEAGCSFVTVAMENPNVPNTFYNWDTHAVNYDNFIDMRNRLPIYDQAITALIEDLHDRGLTKKVLLVVTGEFGRSPRISVSSQGPKGTRYGREHWPGAMSVLLTGGGMQHGQVVGSTNSRGEYPDDRPLAPADLWATVYRHLGIDQNATILDHAGRPQHLLSSGSPIRELI